MSERRGAFEASRRRLARANIVCNRFRSLSERRAMSVNESHFTYTLQL
jgi:hypothetical protein